MNLFNRLAMSLVLIAFILGVLTLALAPDVLVGWLLSDSFRSAVVDSQTALANPLLRVGEALVALLVAVGAFLLLVAELRPRPRQSVVVSQVSGGKAELANESVALRVKRVAEAIAGVRDAVPAIRSRGKAIDLALALTTDPDIDIPQKTDEVMQAVRAEAEGKMGVPVRSLRVTVKHVSRESRLPSPLSGPSPKPGTQV